jgi:hypothetical protein
MLSEVRHQRHSSALGDFLALALLTPNAKSGNQQVGERVNVGKTMKRGVYIFIPIRLESCSLVLVITIVIIFPERLLHSSSALPL